MNKMAKCMIAGTLLAASGAANAQFSSTITAASDYDFRGISQSAKEPALQASLDYGFESGFAIGAWASNIDFEPFGGNFELDLYAGYTGEISETFSWNAGVVYYMYPDADDLIVEGENLGKIEDYLEVYAGLSVGPVGFKQWYSDDLYKLGESAFYTEANASFPIAESGFSILAHVGYSWGDYWDEFIAENDEGDLENFGGELFDYSIGVGYEFSNFTLALKYLGTDASGNQKITDDVLNNEGRVVFTIATTLPWGE